MPAEPVGSSGDVRRLCQPDELIAGDFHQRWFAMPGSCSGNGKKARDA